MPVTLINAFIVPPEKEEEFLMNWRETSRVFSGKEGFIETHLHRNVGVGNPTFTFINIARWETAEAWRSNHTAYTPGEIKIPGVKGHPAIFECIVDMYNEDAMAAHAGTPFLREGFFKAAAAE